MQTTRRGTGMIVLRADAMGMCFGVRDALAVMAGVATPGEVTVHGELVHNPAVQRDLDDRGFHRSREDARAVPATPVVLVTAHGISERERRRLLLADKRLLDTTCPLVEKAHAAAQALASADRRIVVLGKRDHVEVRGIVEDHDRALVVECEDDVADWGERRLGVLCQTTLSEATAARLLRAIKVRNATADVAFADTICSPTKARQAALADLLPRVEAVVVVGGRTSNNTQKLVAAAVAAGVPALHVEGASDVDATFLRGRRVVGLTAGTSTLPQTIDAVEARLRELAGT